MWQGWLLEGRGVGSWHSWHLLLWDSAGKLCSGLCTLREEVEWGRVLGKESDQPWKQSW